MRRERLSEGARKARVRNTVTAVPTSPRERRRLLSELVRSNPERAWLAVEHDAAAGRPQPWRLEHSAILLMVAFAWVCALLALWR